MYSSSVSIYFSRAMDKNFLSVFDLWLFLWANELHSERWTTDSVQMDLMKYVEYVSLL